MTPPPTASSGHAYRPDIDGLRAIAVMAVVLCHASMPGFSGGFLGVDVFFVISGYLITQILIRSDGALRQDILRFYERRLRRIVPALAVVLIACTIAAFLLVSPYELTTFSDTLLSSTGFVSNLYFMRTLEYFNPRFEMPLLHLWSLGVEEQFYIVYPLFLWMMTRHARRLLLPALAAVFLLSLALSEYLAEGHPKLAFFFTGSRAWELLFGAFVALYPMHRGCRAPIAEAIAALGLVAVIAPIGLIGPNTLWPGLHALLPCAGTALLLSLHDERRTAVSRLLSAKPLVGLGLISYSLYLWHWPLFEFYRRWALHIPTPMEYAALIAIALLLAGLSWRFVEQPIRRPHNGLSRAFIVRAAAACAVLMVSVCAAIYATNGFPGRISPQTRHVYSYLNAIKTPNFIAQMLPCFVLDKNKGIYPLDSCFRLSLQKSNVVLWGDSFARNYTAGFREQAQKSNINLIQANFAACLPLSVKVAGQTRACEVFNQAMMMRLNNPIKAVIISARFYNRPELLPALAQTAQLIAHKGIRVIVLGPSLEYDETEPFYVARFLETGEPHWLDSKALLKTGLYPFDLKMQTLFSGQKGITYISVVQTICHDRHCPMKIADAPTQFDYGHMTVESSRAFGAKLWPQVYTAIAATDSARPHGSLVK